MSIVILILKEKILIHILARLMQPYWKVLLFCDYNVQGGIGVFTSLCSADMRLRFIQQNTLIKHCTKALKLT